MRQTVDLNYPRKDGSTLREHLEGYCRQSGTWDDRLAPPPVPPGLAHVWDWFWELSSARGGSGFGPNPIGYNDIRSWMEVTGNEPSGWEVEVMRLLDAEYMSSVRERGKG